MARSLNKGVGVVNLFSAPTDLSDAAWYREGLTVSNAGSANQAVIETGLDEYHIFRQAITKPAIAKKYRIGAVVAADLTRTLFRLAMTPTDFSSGARWNFNVSTPGALTGGAYGGFAVVSSSQFAVSLGGGYSYVGFDFTTNDGTSLQLTAYLQLAEDGETYLGETDKGMSVREVRLYDLGFP